MTLKPGWLSASLDEAHITSMASHDKSFYKSLGYTPQVYPGDPQKLYDVLNKRFKSWTGYTLKDFK